MTHRQEVKKCCWENGANRISLWRFATKLHFVKNNLSEKGNKSIRNEACLSIFLFWLNKDFRRGEGQSDLTQVRSWERTDSFCRPCVSSQLPSCKLFLVGPGQIRIPFPKPVGPQLFLWFCLPWEGPAGLSMQHGVSRGCRKSAWGGGGGSPELDRRISPG